MCTETGINVPKSNRSHVCPLRQRSYSTLKTMLLSKIVFTHFTLLGSPRSVPEGCVWNRIPDSGLEGNAMGLRKGRLTSMELRVLICKRGKSMTEA